MKNIGKFRAVALNAAAAGKRRTAAPSAVAAMPRGTNEDEDSGVSSLESSASEEDAMMLVLPATATPSCWES